MNQSSIGSSRPFILCHLCVIKASFDLRRGYKPMSGIVLTLSLDLIY